MVTAPNTQSTLALPNGVNKTSTAVSTNIIIYVNETPVGAVQQLRINETRQIKMIDELGTDGHIDSVPTKSTDIKGSCERIRFDRLRIAEAFSRGFVHVASQVYPFDIVIIDKQKRDQGSQISTVIKNVWITNISYTYSANDWVISDSMDWEAETIFSILNGGMSPSGGGGAPVATGGERGIKYLNDPSVNIERLVDTGSGGRRGSLDAAGLIDIGSSGDLF
jgi:hypothetical protein